MPVTDASGKKKPETGPGESGQAERPENQPVILIVEDDKVASRYLELSLTRLGAYRLELTQDVAGAMDVLSNSLIDLVLSDIYLPDTDAFQFYRRVRRESRFRNIPFIFVSSDARVATKVAAMQVGVDDYITKPFDVQELRARIDLALQRVRDSRAAYSKRRYNLAGDFTGISFTDLIYLIEVGRRNGTLSLVTRRASAELRFRDGQVLTATFGNLQGEDAFYKLMGEPEGVFEFSPGDVAIEEGSTPLAMTSTALLLEGARRQDDTTRMLAPAARREKAISDESVDEEAEDTEAQAGPVPAPAPDATLAAQLEEGLSDAFALGELQLFTEESLAEWTASKAHPERLHLLLVADLEEGVSSLMSLAAPVTDGQMYTTLTTPVVTLGLVFYMRKERVVDIVLVDQESPAALVEALRRHPGVVLFAPRKGDFLSLGVKPQVGLVTLLQRLPPLALLGLGNASIDDGLAQVQAQAETAIPARCVRSSLGEAGGDLRQVLLTAIKLWSTSDQKAPSSKGGSA